MTLVFEEAGLTLLQVPKTGTTSVEAALAPLASLAITSPLHYRHMPARQFEDDFEPPPGWLYVAVVREPVDWLVSWWRWRHNEPDYRPFHPRGMSFAEWVDAVFSDESHHVVTPLLRYQIPERRTLWWPYENLGGLVQFVADLTGEPAPALPRLNASTAPAPHVPAETRALILDRFAEHAEIHRRVS